MSAPTLATYTPKFRTPSAEDEAAERWGLVTDPVDGTLRMIEALRRLPAPKRTQSLAEAREESARFKIEMAKRDWSKWQCIAWANGIEVRDA